MAESEALLQRALDAGINYIDTARFYTDSEEKIGKAISHRRDDFILATKTMASSAKQFWSDLHQSLSLLKTDHIDIYQFHNPPDCPRPGDGSGLYESAQMAKNQGKLRFIGFTNHRLGLAMEAVKSGLYDTLQFPFSYLSSEKEKALAGLCKRHNVGFIAMKALCGGLLTDVAAARAWFADFDGVVPIWGIQRASELDALIKAMEGPAALTAAQRARIEADRAELSGDFCRGCGYCLPCAANIEIFSCARAYAMIRRMPVEQFLTDEWKSKMEAINGCVNCGECAKRCPYNLNPPDLIRKSYDDYQRFLAEHGQGADRPHA
jgi:aryl-alcohol dehydrogenase-like predicted oxidoreductase